MIGMLQFEDENNFQLNSNIIIQFLIYFISKTIELLLF